MRAIDTNVIVRMIVRDDERQAAAADQFIRQGAWVSTLVLTEAAWVFATAYGFSPTAVVEAIELLLEHRDLIFEDVDAIRLAAAAFRDRPSPRFTGCMVLELARKAGHLPLGTFDRRLGKENGARKI